MSPKNIEVKISFIMLILFGLFFFYPNINISKPYNEANPYTDSLKLESEIQNINDINYDWPMYGYDALGTGSTPASGPITSHMLWKIKTGWISSPVVSSGLVYYTGDKRLYCVSASTGQQIWNYTTRRDWNVIATPAVSGGFVYFGSYAGRFYCLDAYLGHEVWRYRTEPQLESGFGRWILSPATVVDGRVYFSSMHDIAQPTDKTHCLNASTGELIWEFLTDDWSTTHPAVHGGNVYIGTQGSTSVLCLDAINGGSIWNFSYSIVTSSPSVADGYVYFGSGKLMFCLNASSGQQIWNYTTGDWIYSSSPAIYNEKIYFGSGDNKLYCLSAATGGYLWSFTTEWEVSSSPAVAGGKVYFGSNDGNVYCVDTRTGSLIWNHLTNGSIYSSPAVSGGCLYISSDDGYLYAFGLGTTPKLLRQHFILYGGLSLILILITEMALNQKSKTLFLKQENKKE